MLGAKGRVNVRMRAEEASGMSAEEKKVSTQEWENRVPWRGKITKEEWLVAADN